MDYSTSDPAGRGVLSGRPRRRKDCHVLAQEGRNAHREALTTLGDACWLFLKQDLHDEGEADKGLFSGCATLGAGAEGPRQSRGAGSCTWLQHWGSIVLHHAADLACLQANSWKMYGQQPPPSGKVAQTSWDLLGGVENWVRRIANTMDALG